MLHCDDHILLILFYLPKNINIQYIKQSHTENLARTAFLPVFIQYEERKIAFEILICFQQIKFH